MPGSGATPPALTGREPEQAALNRCLADLASGVSPPHDVVLTGPRGNGKTALADKVQECGQSGRRRRMRIRRPGRAGVVLDAAATGGYVATMRSVGLKTLNDNPSEYVWLAAAGETVLVTDHDRVVAEIVPPRVERDPVPDDPKLTTAAREGWLMPPTAPGSGPPPAPPPIMSLDQLLRDLGEDRRDR